MTERYLIVNGAAPTTAAQVALATGTAIITHLQVKLGRAIMRGLVVEWGISFDGLAAAAPIDCELLTTKTVAATVTAHVAAGIINLDPLAVTPADLDPFDFGTAATGYDASAEGTITATRMLDVQHVAPTNQYIKQWPLGREPEIGQDEFLRIRTTSAASVGAYAYVVLEV